MFRTPVSIVFYPNCQATGTENGNGPGGDSIISSATNPPTTTTPQLLTMKEHSDNKVPLVNMSQNDPLNPSSKYQVDSHNNNLGESNMIKEKVINNS